MASHVLILSSIPRCPICVKLPDNLPSDLSFNEISGTVPWEVFLAKDKTIRVTVGADHIMKVTKSRLDSFVSLNLQGNQFSGEFPRFNFKDEDPVKNNYYDSFWFNFFDHQFDTEASNADFHEMIDALQAELEDTCMGSAEQMIQYWNTITDNHDLAEFFSGFYDSGCGIQRSETGYISPANNPFFSSGSRPFGELNIADNNFSGPVPIDINRKIATFFQDGNAEPTFSGLWLLGNNWDGGPCASLCTSIGPLSNAKIAESKLLATKCLYDTSAQEGMPDSEYSIDRTGQCTLKTRTCIEGEFYVARRTAADPSCKRCPVSSYQFKSSHNETECQQQPECGPGQFISKDNDNLRIQSQNCSACGNDMYQPEQKHRLTECIAQPYCGAGQSMSADTTKERRQCSDCPAGRYQNISRHRSTSCTKQPKCGPGTLFSGSVYAERTCAACPQNTYQTAIDHNKPTCIPQQGCPPQHEFVGNRTTEGRCELCKDMTLQPKTNHFDKCFTDPSLEKTACNSAGKLNAASGICDCNTGFAGPMCEFSDEETCSGHGNVSYDGATKLPSCSNCTGPEDGVGEWCQFSTFKTCKDLGSVSPNGTCKWKSEVSECPPGYYYNPDPEMPDNKEEDAIEVGDDNCYPCSPGEYATNTARRVQCNVCPTLQTSEAASTSISDCFAKFQTAADNQQFCYGEGTITSGDSKVVEAKSLSRITSSEDCSISAASLGFTFAGEYVLPYSGCVYDETRQEARFYVDQKKYNQALSARTNDNDNDNSTDNDDDEDDSRQRRKEHQQYQQRQRKQQQPREQDQQLRKHHHQKRRRRWNLAMVPKKDTPLCEFYVCKDPANTVIPLSGDLSNAAKTPSCRVSIGQTKKAYNDEQAESQSTFMPAALSITGATLVGSYVQQYRSTSRAGHSFTIWHHLTAWLTSLRMFDMLTDFGFYFISLHGGAFLEAYGDGDPETTPYEEPKVAAFLFVSVFCTALGLFMTPLDVWAMSQRAVGGGMSIVGIAIVLSITLFEDTPQLALASMYIATMRKAGINLDAVSTLSLGASALSMLFNVATVVYYTRKLRKKNPTGWWKSNTNGASNTSDQTTRRIIAENATLKQELAQLKSKKKTKKQGRSTVKTVNPTFAGSFDISGC